MSMRQPWHTHTRRTGLLVLTCHGAIVVVGQVCTLREYHKPAWPGGRENVSSWLSEMGLDGTVMGEVSDWQVGPGTQTDGGLGHGG